MAFFIERKSLPLNGLSFFRGAAKTRASREKKTQGRGNAQEYLRVQESFYLCEALAWQLT
jgi:hypothetical protein